MPLVKLRDLSINYYDNKNIHKPAMIFLHGLGENLESWVYQVKKFDATYRVIAMDLRGHGLTNDGELPITIEQFASDVVTLVDYLQIKHAHFIGLSMGGMICQELTRNHQTRMLSMILCNTAAFAANLDDFSLDKRLNKMKNTPMTIMADYVTKNCLPKGYTKELYDKTLNMFLQNRHVPYLAATAVAFSIDFRDILEQIYIPTLIVVGALDIVTPVTSAKYLHEHIRGSQLVIIPNAGHLTKLENPILFNKAVVEFLDIQNRNRN